MEECQIIESDEWKEKEVEEDGDEVKVEVDCMWDLSATEIRELDIQRQDFSKKCVEKLALNPT